METANLISDINQKAEELIHIIKTRFVTKDGLLARTCPVSKRTLFDNFDDIVPFFIYFGETDFLLSQVKIIRKQGESLISLCAENGVLVTRNIDEWFGGLHSLWEKTGDRITYGLLKESVEFVLTKVIRNDFLSAAYYPESGYHATYYECWSSGLLETFCEMRAEFPQAFEQAQRILKTWLQEDYFLKYMLFPYRVFSSPIKRNIQKKLLSNFSPIRRYSMPPPPFGRGIGYALKAILKKVIFHASNGLYSQLMKSNSTCAFTLLEFFKATNDNLWSDTLLKWINSAIHFFCDQGKVFMEVNPKSGVRRDAGITPAFIIVDVLCDTLFFAVDLFKNDKERLLKKAKNILDYHWDNRLENGLLPYHDNGLFAHIDSQVDFAVSLRRYFELSGDEDYKHKSIKLTKRVIDQHYSPDGYYTYSGEITDNVIDPKYNALLLKGIINLITIDDPIYPDFYSLFKDR